MAVISRHQPVVGPPPRPAAGVGVDDPAALVAAAAVMDFPLAALAGLLRPELLEGRGLARVEVEQRVVLPGGAGLQHAPGAEEQSDDRPGDGRPPLQPAGRLAVQGTLDDGGAGGEQHGDADRDQQQDEQQSEHVLDPRQV
jgi:hypothetical protein